MHHPKRWLVLFSVQFQSHCNFSSQLTRITFLKTKKDNFGIFILVSKKTLKNAIVVLALRALIGLQKLVLLTYAKPSSKI